MMAKIELVDKLEGKEEEKVKKEKKAAKESFPIKKGKTRKEAVKKEAKGK